MDTLQQEYMDRSQWFDNHKNRTTEECVQSLHIECRKGARALKKYASMGMLR